MDLEGVLGLLWDRVLSTFCGFLIAGTFGFRLFECFRRSGRSSRPFGGDPWISLPPSPSIGILKFIPKHRIASVTFFVVRAVRALHALRARIRQGYPMRKFFVCLAHGYIQGRIGCIFCARMHLMCTFFFIHLYILLEYIGCVTEKTNNLPKHFFLPPFLLHLLPPRG